MLTYTQLVGLHRSLSGRRVLSVYLDGSASDPAFQRSWRVQLDHHLAEARRRLDGAERDELAQCVHRLDVAMADFAVGIGAPGWAAFITADRVHGVSFTGSVATGGPCIASSKAQPPILC